MSKIDKTLHPLTDLINRQNLTLYEVDAVIRDYLRQRAEWLKKEYGIKEATPPQHDIISDAFELSVGEKCEQCENPLQKGMHTCITKIATEFATSVNEIMKTAGGAKPIEPKPKLPEKIEHKSCDCVRLRLDEICADRIDKLIDYLRGGDEQCEK